jgi:antitoxin HicB
MKNLDYYLSLNYHRTVTQDDEGDYIIEVQELRGCVADGKTPNEAVENLREAMKAWLGSRVEAGLEVPEPRAEEDYSGKILVRMAKYLHQRLADQSAREGVSLNQHIVMLLADASARVNAAFTLREELQYFLPVGRRTTNPSQWAAASAAVVMVGTNASQVDPLANEEPFDLCYWGRVVNAAPSRAIYNYKPVPRLGGALLDRNLLDRKKTEA